MDRISISQAAAKMQKTMYVCAIDRQRSSPAYGQQVIVGRRINVWLRPDPERIGIHHKMRHGMRVTVVEEHRVHDRHGGLWYRLKEGGWMNDMWLTEKPCTNETLEELSVD